MLAAAGAVHAVGVDIDEATVEHARSRYGLEFRRADVGELPFDDASFDLVASFETIEHVEDGERVLRELSRVLTADGLLVVSTPNADESLVDNEFHVHEYRAEEFLTLLRSEFDAVHVVYQHNWLASAVLERVAFEAEGVEAPLDVDTYKTVGAGPGRELYTIAICGRADHSALRDVVVATDVYEAHRLVAHADESARLVGEWTARATEAESLVERWHARATEAESLVERWHARATEAERQLADAHATLERIGNSASWRLTAPLRRSRSRLRGRNG